MTTSVATALPVRVKALYERVRTERASVLDDLSSIYAADVLFANPVAEDRGIEPFRRAWEKAFRLYKVFEFHDIVVAGNDDAFTLSYHMQIRFAVGPHFRIDMVTQCRGRNGQVVYVRDYFDPLGTLLGPIAPLRWLYRVVFRVLVA